MKQLSLWTFLEPLANVLLGRPVAPGANTHAPPRTRKRPASSPGRPGAQDRYDQIVRDKIAQYGLKVRKWRTSMSGVAWVTQYRDGTVKRFIEAPRPKSPMSLAIFLHEVGHHHIGLGAYKPRCLEEYHAWKYAVDEMARLGVPVTDRVRRRMDRSLRYAVGKASRRGLRNLPAELAAYARG
jgi:hypothetical protein